MTFGGVLVLLLGGSAAGQTTPRPSLDSGGVSGEPAVSNTGLQHSVHWQRIALRDAIGRLNEASDLVVFLDRRVDPTQRVSLSLDDAPVERIASELADACSLGTSRIDGLVYVGPEESAKHLATLAALRRQEVAQLPPEARRSLFGRRRIAWPRLTEPRDLVVQWAQTQGWRVSESELIEHDLWRAGELPALTVADQLTLLLVGFERTFRVVPGDAAIEIVLIDELPALERIYDLPSVAQTSIEQLAQQFPEASFEVVEGQLRAAGRWEDLERIGRLLQGTAAARPSPRRPQQTKQVFTLRVEEQPVGAVLEALARQLDWELVVDEAAIRQSGRSLRRRVSFAVENVEIDELLEALLKPAELSFEREGRRVRIGPRSP